METFTFTLPTGPIFVNFYEKPTLPLIPSSGGIYVADTNTVSLLRNSENFSPSVPLVIIEAGEEHKTLLNIEKILSAALHAGLARDSLFIGFGGGVITDMTAFAASLYMRGARLELVPTTLLAMADAAIGGKTGIDFENFKNSVGTFYPATVIHISVAVLESLSDKEFLSGLAEVVKTGMLYAPKLYEILQTKKTEILSKDKQLLQEIVKRCVQAKAKVVERDFLEKGERMYLNLGHTFGHALESVAGFGTITHGDAVAWGIARAMETGMILQITDVNYRNEVLSLLQDYGWCITPIHPILAGQNDCTVKLISAMKNDKKKKAGKVRFVLQREINSTLVTEVEDETIRTVLS